MSSKTKSKAAPDLNLKSLVAHALCDTVPGGMSNEEYNALVEDLKTNGMRVPIVLYQGKILDGRERYRAAQSAGIEIKYEQFDGSDDAARHYVMSLNLQRRTLTGMQKALAVAELYKREVNKGGAYPSQDVLAKRYGVSKQTISLCCKAIDSKNNMLLTRMRRGEVTRGELEEEFYDGKDTGAQPVGSATVTDGDIFGSAPAPSNVRLLFGNAGAGRNSAQPELPKRSSQPAKRTSETPASVALRHFKALSDKDRAAFVAMAWPWLEPHVVAHQAVAKAAKSSSEATQQPARKPRAKAA